MRGVALSIILGFTILASAIGNRDLTKPEQNFTYIILAFDLFCIIIGI